uniref:Uncharacterized protein n=1 Tax=Timema poppense TaxID=170557 RepID=A0A7R9DG45_TIMPO|nr:unnamed protein product [Timema poppensis]
MVATDRENRENMGKYGFDTPHDYNDHELYCGGFTRQWKNNNGNTESYYTNEFGMRTPICMESGKPFWKNQPQQTPITLSLAV